MLKKNAGKKKTGVEASQTRFTVVFPIHNEEANLESFFGSIMFSDIPKSAHITFVAVTNACIDRSFDRVRFFMQNIGELRPSSIATSLYDEEVDNEIQEVRSRNLRFIHINTATPSKANVLILGNKVARSLGNNIAMSIDANIWVEPDAIQTMYSHVIKSIQAENSNSVLFDGQQKREIRKSALKPFILLYRSKFADTPRGSINGWFMAWDTKWFEGNGGIPLSANEDYGMAIKARLERKYFEHSMAEIWGYESNGIGDRLSEIRRHIRGALQIISFYNQDEQVSQMIKADRFLLRPLPDRVKYFLKRAREKPIGLPFFILNFILWEYGLFRGKQDYNKNPQDHSWQPIRSTKSPL